MLFGYLADRFGRTRLYGIELVLVIVSTIGVATSSHGYGDISFIGLFIWWRFVMGIGALHPPPRSFLDHFGPFGPFGPFNEDPRLTSHLARYWSRISIKCSNYFRVV